MQEKIDKNNQIIEKSSTTDRKSQGWCHIGTPNKPPLVTLVAKRVHLYSFMSKVCLSFFFIFTLVTYTNIFSGYYEIKFFKIRFLVFKSLCLYLSIFFFLFLIICIYVEKMYLYILFFLTKHPIITFLEI